MKIKKLTLNYNTIPNRLMQQAQPPKELYVLGPLEDLLDGPVVAVVGSRKVSNYGRSVTDKIVRELAEQGITIVSGLALGLDSLAHMATLEVGGKTIAVLPAGLGKIYPASHTHIARRILGSGGALVSEYPLDTAPQKYQFIARNRLIAGLADGILLPEAAEKSGSLHTANFGLEQGKTVMSVPGNITSDLSAGTNNLIKAGAIPITSSDDVIHALGITHLSLAKPRPLGSTKAETDILNMLGGGVTDAALLHSASGLNAIEFNQTLTMLEIAGKIRSIGSDHWILS